MKKLGFTGMKDTDKLILLELKYPDLVNACEYDTFITDICKDKDFWKTYLLKNYGITGKEVDSFVRFLHFDNQLNELAKYLYSFGDDAKFVIRMLRDNIIDKFIIGNTLRDPYFVPEANFLHKHMRREIPKLILNNTDRFLIFYLSQIQESFGKFFIEVKDDFPWVLIEPKYLNKSKLLFGRTPVRARKSDVPEGEDWETRFYTAAHLKRYAEEQWAKFEAGQ